MPGPESPSLRPQPPTQDPHAQRWDPGPEPRTPNHNPGTPLPSRSHPTRPTPCAHQGPALPTGLSIPQTPGDSAMACWEPTAGPAHPQGTPNPPGASPLPPPHCCLPHRSQGPETWGWVSFHWSSWEITPGYTKIISAEHITILNGCSFSISCHGPEIKLCFPSPINHSLYLELELRGKKNKE